MSKPDEDGDDADSNFVDNPFTSESLNRDISLSVYNTPKKLVENKERPAITSDYLLRNIKGYKPPSASAGEGEPVLESASKSVRESLLPEINEGIAEMITKDETN